MIASGSDPLDAVRRSLPGWAAGMRNALGAVIELTQVPVDDVDRDPLTMIPYLQRYTDTLPLDEFETDDWVTLQTDLVSFLARAMAVRCAATWDVRASADAPRGYRLYVLQAFDARGVLHHADPFDIVAREFADRPIEIARMLATTELTLGASVVEQAPLH